MDGELIGGTLYKRSRPLAEHALARAEIEYELRGAFVRGRDGPGGWHIVSEPELHLDDDILVPDLAGWRLETMPVYPKEAFFDIAPDWVCEVLSPETRQVDSGPKLDIYAREAVSHVWFVDPHARTLEAFELDNGRWILLAKRADDAPVCVSPFDAISFPLNVVWFGCTADGMAADMPEATKLDAAPQRGVSEEATPADFDRIAMEAKSTAKTSDAEVALDAGARMADPKSLFNPEYEDTLRAMIRAFVLENGPVHIDAVTREIAKRHGWARAGGRIRRHLEGASDGIAASHEAQGTFLWPGMVEDQIEWRGPLERNPDEIPVAELAGLLKSEPGILNEEDPVLALARRLGLSRLGEGRRAVLQDLLSAARARVNPQAIDAENAKFYERPSSPEGIAAGDRVRVRHLSGSRSELQFTLTEHTSDPENGIVRTNSPLGQALLGSAQGEEIEYLKGSHVQRAIVEKVFKVGLPSRDKPDLAPSRVKGAWVGKGVTLPETTMLRMKYRGQHFHGTIENGRWVVDGKTYGSPSGAAGTVVGNSSRNGWKDWYVKRPFDQEWLALDELRKAT